MSKYRIVERKQEMFDGKKMLFYVVQKGAWFNIFPWEDLMFYDSLQSAENYLNGKIKNVKDRVIK